MEWSGLRRPWLATLSARSSPDAFSSIESVQHRPPPLLHARTGLRGSGLDGFFSHNHDQQAMAPMGGKATGDISTHGRNPRSPHGRLTEGRVAMNRPSPKAKGR